MLHPQKFNDTCYLLCSVRDGEDNIRKYQPGETIRDGMAILEKHINILHPLNAVGKLGAIKGIIRCLEAGIQPDDISHDMVIEQAKA